MEIATDRYKHCAVLHLRGRVDSYTAPQLTEAIEALNQEGIFKLVLNLSEVDFMSSAGFRALLIGQRNCKRYNRGEIVLANVPPRLREALDLTGFTPLFKIFDNLTAAVGHF